MSEGEREREIRQTVQMIIKLAVKCSSQDVVVPAMVAVANAAADADGGRPIVSKFCFFGFCRCCCCR